MESDTAVCPSLSICFWGCVVCRCLASLWADASALLGPTGGYMVAYPLMVVTIGLCMKLFPKQGFAAYFFSMLASLIICYLFGSAWLAISAHMTFGAAVMAGVVPFVVFDILKAVFAAYLCCAAAEAPEIGIIC